MTEEEIKVIRGLKSRGFAVITWTPNELRNAKPHKVEQRSIELGWDIIEAFQ